VLLPIPVTETRPVGGLVRNGHWGIAMAYSGSMAHASAFPCLLAQTAPNRRGVPTPARLALGLGPYEPKVGEPLSSVLEIWR
jgi:hypothetical protein